MTIQTTALFKDIVQVVIVPIVLGIVVKTLFRRQAEASVKALPLVSTVAIVLIIAIIVALNQAKLLTNGLLMFAAVILHNLLGFALGYLFAPGVRHESREAQGGDVRDRHAELRPRRRAGGRAFRAAGRRAERAVQRLAQPVRVGAGDAVCPQGRQVVLRQNVHARPANPGYTRLRPTTQGEPRGTTSRNLSHFFPVRFRVLHFLWGRTACGATWSRKPGMTAMRPRITACCRPGHRGGARRHPMADGGPAAELRFFVRRSVHRCDERRQGHADLGHVPLRLPGRPRSVHRRASSTASPRYCRAAAAYVVPRVRGPHFFTPINEITFFSFCAGEWGWVAPYRRTREDRDAPARWRCAAPRSPASRRSATVDPEARMVHVDPLVRVVRAARPARPGRGRAPRDLRRYLPRLGHPVRARASRIRRRARRSSTSSARNRYSFGQMEYREHGPHAPLPPGDDRIAPLCDMLRDGLAALSPADDHRRDQRHRPRARRLAARCDGRIAGGGPARHGPAGHLPVSRRSTCRTGIAASGCTTASATWSTENGDLRRVPDQEYIDELRRWQKELNRVTALDEDPFSDPVELQDVIDAAQRLNMQPDKDWC